MKKNYIAVFHKAENLLITLFFLLVSSIPLHSYAQSYSKIDRSALNISQKGPFDNGERGTLDAPPPPVITYTPLSNTCATGDRVLTATITDADGVPNAGNARPVLYWQINSGVFNPAPGTWTGGSQYNFTFGAGAVAGNLVSYYIVAQDNTGNVIAEPSAGAGGYTTTPPAAATDPSAPDFYVIQTTLATGTYNVGVGQTYLTLTDAINAYNNSCLSGDITFILTDAAYNTSEVFPLTINNPQASSLNKLFIKPNTGINTIIQGTASDAIFKLNGADYITIDGSNTVGGTTRNLSIINSSTNLTSSVIWVGSASASNGATHNTVKHCIISGNAGNTTLAGIIQSSGIIAGQAAETANGDNTYQNNSISASYNGIILFGPAAGESNTVITGNSIGSTLSPKKLGYRGIQLTNQTNVLVNGNTINGVITSIGLGSDTEPPGGIIVSGAISGGNIAANIINDVWNTNVAGWPAYGISLQSSSAAANLKIHNNFVYSILGVGNTTTAAFNGIGIAILSGGGYGIYFNSIHLFTQQTTTGAISAAIFIGSGVTGTASVDIRNNILSSKRPLGTNYGLYCSVPNIIFSNINYNDYSSSNFIGYLGSNRATIAGWQAATGMDGNSVIVNPIFANPAAPVDLHLQFISPLNAQGTPIAGITVDIDGAVRSANPDIGADEFTPPDCSGNFGGTATSDFSTVCSSGSVSLSAAGFSFGLGISYQWEFSATGTAGSWNPVPGETNPTSANPPSISATTYYRLRVVCSLTGGSPGYSNTLTITVYKPNILTTTPGSRCGPGTVNIAATGTPTTAVQWYAAATGGTPLYTGSPFTTPSISATTTYYAESVYLGSSGTVGPVSPSAQGGTISTQLTSWEVTFNVIQATKLLTVDVYPLVSGENAAIAIYNSVGTMLDSVPYTTNVAGGATAQTVTLNVPLPIGNGYYMYAPNGIPATGLSRNITGASYPYNSSDIVITGNGFNLTFFMCYYNWRFSNGCSSTPRTAVTATVASSASLSISASPSSICAGGSSTLTASSTNTSFIYTWTPGPLVGASQTVNPVTTTTYTVNASDGTCTATGSVTVTVNPSSSPVDITPATVTKCFSAPAQILTASGGDIAAVNIINEDFNGPTPGPPAGWVTGTTGTTGVVASKTWTLRPDGYVPPLSGATFHSNDNSQFYITNAYNLAGITKTTLQTPQFSLVGYTSANLYFYHHFAQFNSIDSAVVEYATAPAGPWSFLRKFNSRGASNNFRKDTISLDPYIGVAVNYIRFRYYCPGPTGAPTNTSAGFYWGIDNVSIKGGNTGSPITWSPTTGLYTDAGAATPYSGAVTTSVYAKPTVTTTYTATASPVNGCQSTQTIDVIVRPIRDSVAVSAPLACPGDAITVSIYLWGTGPWNLTYTNSVTPVTVNNIATSPYTFVVNPLVTSSYSVTALNDAFCTAGAADHGPPVSVMINPVANSTWRGLSSDWTDPANWCGGVPTAVKDVSIPVTANSPVITVATAVAHDISISTGASLTIDPAGVFSFKGNFVNDGTIINNGSIVMNGSTAQSFPGGGATGSITAMNILEVNNSSAAGATINRAITITGTLKPTAGNITLDNIVVTLKSNASATASVSALGASAGFVYNGTGKFSIERFISTNTPADAGWRFLAAPLRSDAPQTIHEAWQENQPAGSTTDIGGYGMQIVGPSSAGPGFDLNNAITSLKTYSPATSGWVTVPGTTITPITTTEGYMAFIRGNRSSATFGSASPTTLRMAGPIKTGTVGPISTTIDGGLISIGNPYPSAIDLTATTRNGLMNLFYIWDPAVGVYGGYQTISAANGWKPVPGGTASYDINVANPYIQSGQAFFVVAIAAAVPHNITFGESNKVSGSLQVQRTGSNGKELRTRLYAVSTGTPALMDGTLTLFDAANSNNVDELDAPKISNFGENIGILNSGKILAVESHAEIIDTDTIFFQLGQLRQQGYQLEFTAQDLAAPGLTAYLEDLYLHTTTIINLNAVSIIDFNVNSDPASRAADRFRLVFRQLGPVPVTFTSITAHRQEKNILVSWKVENELNIDHYEIERSVEGRSFVKIGSQVAAGNNGNGSVLYHFLDTDPATGDNYYRVKSVGAGNDIKYSEIVKVGMEEEPTLITLYPNPVRDHWIGLSFNNLPEGDYDIRLFNLSGQLVMQERMNHPGGNQRVKLPVDPALAKGLYNLEIIFIKTKTKKRVFKVVIE